ncbi:MAG: molybdate transport system substrate-binding protein [Actinomycetota bacterium]
MVFAATSLTGAFTEIGQGFEDAHPEVEVTFNFAASSALAQQILDGARADVFASADEANLTKVELQGAVFARNRLVVVTKPGNPLQVRTLADLASVDGVISLCGLEVPCGKYAAEALTNAGVTIDESNVTRGNNVATTLTAVTQGDAAAAIVYASDAAAAGERVATVTIPESQNVIATYPIAVLPRSANGATARAFVAYVRGDPAQRVLARLGFLKP